MDKPLIVVPGEQDVELVNGYRVAEWRGHKNYVCIYCQYATLWLDKMKKHQKEDSHPWAWPGQNKRAVEKDPAGEPEY